MASIHVVTDSAGDLPPELADARDIRVVPLTIRFGDEELVDQVELSAKEFWDRVTTGQQLPETAAPSPGAFQQAFADAAERGADGVLCITLSSGVSATYQSARTAAEALAATIPVSVVDSRTLTMGSGLLALAAADLAAEGLDLATLTARIEEMKARTSVFGVIATLDFLHRGGRIGGAARLVGSMLAIKPVIEVRDGVVEVESKQRTRSRSLDYLVAKVRDSAPLERLAVVHGAAADVDVVVSQLHDVEGVDDVLVADLGPVVGTHAGPGTIGVCMVRR
jgi:DegV family protein with EDD domain